MEKSFFNPCKTIFIYSPLAKVPSRNTVWCVLKNINHNEEELCQCDSAGAKVIAEDLYLELVEEQNE
jgi:hypothetical protein